MSKLIIIEFCFCTIHIFNIYKMYKFVSNITFKSDTYKGIQEYNPPIKFDNNRYNYYIKILNVRFSNNVPNITSTLELYIDNILAVSISPGLYEVEDLTTIVNNNTTAIKCELNTSNGHMTIKNIDTNNHTISGSLINSIQFGEYNAITIEPNVISTSPKMCAVSDTNFFKLTSNTIAPSSYESVNGKLITTNTLYTFSAAIDKFGFKDFTSFQDICYPLNMDQLQLLDFALTDENGTILKVIQGAKSDFNIQAVIVKELK